MKRPLVFLFAAALLLAGCGAPSAAPMAAPPPAEETAPIIAGAPPPGPAYLTSPPPEEQGSTDSLRPDDFSADQVISSDELAEADFAKLVAGDEACGDALAYAGELGYTDFVVAERNTYKNGATYTLATFVSGSKDVVFISWLEAEKNACTLVRYRDVEVRDGEITAGTVEVFDREGGMTMDLATLRAEEYGGHYSCNNWHCYGACASLIWNDPVVGFFCGDFLVACLLEPTHLTCIGLALCAGGTLAFCAQCDFDPCDYCYSDSCGQPDTWYPLTCNMYDIGYYQTRYYCQDPDSGDSQCIAYDAFRIVTDCPQRCVGLSCVSNTPTPLSVTPTLTNTPWPTYTPRPTLTPRPSGTPSPTFVNTSTPWPTKTPTPTWTRQPTRTPTLTPKVTLTHTPWPTSAIGVSLSGYVSDERGNPLKNIYIYIIVDSVETGYQMNLIGITDGSGYYYKRFQPVEGDAYITVFASDKPVEYQPEESKFDPAEVKWFHKKGNENLVLDFTLIEG